MSCGTLDPAQSALFFRVGLSPSLFGFPKTVLLTSQNLKAVRNPRSHATWFRLFRVRSPLLTESSFFLFFSGYLDVSVPRVPSIRYGLAYGYMRSAHHGFPPFRDLPDQWIFAPPRSLSPAYHVFLRPLVPGIRPVPFLLLDHLLLIP